VKESESFHGILRKIIMLLMTMGTAEYAFHELFAFRGDACEISLKQEAPLRFNKVILHRQAIALPSFFMNETSKILHSLSYPGGNASLRFLDDLSADCSEERRFNYKKSSN
jgi:hypothetical protein